VSGRPESPKRWRTILLPLLLLAVGGVIFYTGLHFLRRERIPAVPVVRAEEREIRPRILATGRVKPAREELVRARLSGLLTELYVKEGDRVEAGQALARVETEEAAAQAREAEALESRSRLGGELETREARAALAEASARYEEAAREYDRLLALYREEAAPRQTLDQALHSLVVAEAAYRAARERLSLLPALQESQVASTRAGREAAELRLSRGTVAAFGPGTVLEVLARPGALLSPGDPVVRLGDIARVEVEVFLSEEDVGLIRPGDKVRVSARSAPGREFAGVVSRVGLVARVPPGPENLEAPEEGRVPVYVSIPSAGGQLRPGVTAEVEIAPGIARSLAIPAPAVFRREGKTYVYVRGEGSILELRQVATGPRDDRYVAITSGLREGEEVVLEPRRPGLREGVRVRPLPQVLSGESRRK